MLAQQLETVNLRIHHSARDLTPAELAARPLPGVNPIAFLLWHMARSQDCALAVPGIGTGFELDEAARVAARFELHDLLEYVDAVHRDTVAWLHTVDEDFLDSIPDVAAHDARHAAYQTPGFRAEMDSGPEHDDAMGRSGGLPVWIFLTSVSVTHLHRHLGELDLVKDFLRRPVSSSPSRR